MKRATRTITGSGLFAAIVVVLQMLGGGIRFGIFSVSLVLVPIVVGAAVYGWKTGAFLGLVFGVTVLLTGDAGVFLAINPAGAVLTVLVKGLCCGLAAGLCYRALAARGSSWAVPAAAFCAPLVNTGIFLLGCRLFFMDFVRQLSAEAGYANAGVYMIVGLAGVNFLLELAVNGLLSPVIARLIRVEARERGGRNRAPGR